MSKNRQRGRRQTPRILLLTRNTEEEVILLSRQQHHQRRANVWSFASTGVGSWETAPSGSFISLRDFVHAQQRVEQDLHGPHGLDNRRERLSEAIYLLLQNQRFEEDAMRESLSRQASLATPTIPVHPTPDHDKESLRTPESIAAGQ
ncbi:hypothetical protein SARC_11716, partial [Sphaeroforma arctica JP610]